jgi:uncharacterized repeat protein (TIGR01451 family)
MRRTSLRCSILAAACFLLPAFAADAAHAGETQSPHWTVTSVSRPTNFKPGDQSGEDSYRVTVTNTGGAASDGTPIEITDELPEGLTLDPAGASAEDMLSEEPIKCFARTCTYTGMVVPDETIAVTFPVDVAAGSFSDTCQVPTGAAGCVTNVVRVTGGGASDASMATPTIISDTPAGFGISPGGATTALSSSQAGAHPDITTSIAFNTVNSNGALASAVKNTIDELPPGFAGDLVDMPACAIALFSREECPTDTQVGVTTLTLSVLGHPSTSKIEPVYNLAPNPGAAAKIGFSALKIFGVQGDILVRPSDYGLTATFENIEESGAELDNVSLTIWGVPEDPIHDPLRYSGGALGHYGVPSGGTGEVPFFSSPTACASQPAQARFTVEPWEEGIASSSAEMPLGPFVGCDRLSMEPSLTAEATTKDAYAASGLDLRLSIPQTYENADGLATSTLKRAVVTLPEGMTVNPSAGAGLVGCAMAQYAEEGARFVAGQGCPNESKLGTVKIVTPSLKEEVTGSVFLAQPYDNLTEFGEPLHPLGSLLALYVVARLPDRGIVIKTAGKVEPNLETGRLTTTFDNLPPLPFSIFTFSFTQGPTSPLVTPPVCGDYTVQAMLTPWSNPEGVPLTPPIPAFPITQNFNGGACPAGGVPPFDPHVISGTEDNDAGAYSPFYLRIVREDGEQEITKFTSIFPSGLTGNLTGIPFCPEADIEAARGVTGAQELEHPSCPAASEIGHTLVGAGVGSQLAEAPGKIYLAGPYNGSALSVVSITAAKVGPFDLGTVVIRFALSINPITAQVEINGANSDPIPHIIKGIVVHVRDIRAYIDREKFILNPTDCDRSSISETITGAGANPAIPADQMTVGASAPFQAADCANLAFKPTFKATTSAKTSRRSGESLHVKITYPNAPQGSQANIKSVKVDLPRQLPSRLTTLQKACLAKVFEANPSACPAASRVGMAKAVTPILPVPLEGPAYFVSYGDLKFPELIIVLQGYGFTIYLHGETFISKAGITSSTFRTVPDEPVVSFELTLPQGSYSALASNGNLCKVKGGLKMPTVLTAQNGTVIKQSTPISVSGCPKVKKPHKSAKHGKKRAHGKK